MESSTRHQYVANSNDECLTSTDSGATEGRTSSLRPVNSGGRRNDALLYLISFLLDSWETHQDKVTGKPRPRGRNTYRNHGTSRVEESKAPRVTHRHKSGRDSRACLTHRRSYRDDECFYHAPSLWWEYLCQLSPLLWTVVAKVRKVVLKSDS